MQMHYIITKTFTETFTENCTEFSIYDNNINSLREKSIGTLVLRSKQLH